ncbi:MAG: FAD-dependent oxidoreductase, partial [Burkholderiaceae bacterium]
MRIAVIGAGIVGVTTAWFLRDRGFEVTVYEMGDGPALATSAGNAGIVAPGYVTPWAAPGMPRKLAGYLGKAASPIIFRPTANPAQWRWLARWLAECSPDRYRRNRARMQRIARLGRDALRELRATT